MNGRRTYDLTDPLDYKAGDFGRWKGQWYAKTPSGHLGNLRLHEVVEHADGNISVKPAITVHEGPAVVYRGYLERGRWRAVEEEAK